MPFGQQVGSMKKLKEGLKSGAGPIKFIPKNGNIMVRFLEEPDKWVKYLEVFDSVRNVGWPVPEDESAPGFPDPDMRKTKRYLANVVNIERDEVVALQMPTSLVNDLVVRYERYDTLLDRDYELFRTGEGMTNTTYGLTPEPASKRNMAKYKAIDLEDALRQAYDAVWADSDGDDIDEDVPPPRKAATKAAAPAKKAAKAAKRVPEPEPEPEPEASVALYDLGELADSDSEGNDAAVEQLTDLAKAAGIDPDDYGTWANLAEALAEQDGDEDEPFDAEDEAEPAEDTDSDNYSEEELMGMSIGELRVLARDNGIVTRGMSKGEVVAALMGAE
jgi:hypothetical protein